MALDGAESEQIGRAAGNVLAQYDIPVDNPKTAAWLGLAVTVGGIYGAKLMALKLNSELAKAA